MKLRTKIAFWLVVFSCVSLIFLTSGISASVPNAPSISTNPEITESEWTQYIIKIGISVLMLMVGYFFQSWYNNVRQQQQVMAEGQQKMMEITNALKMEVRLLREANKQLSTNVGILSKRQNRLFDWKNKHDLLHAKHSK